MRVSYKKLWKLLIDKDMNKTDLRNATGISSFMIVQMTRDEDVSTSILKRVCAVMKYDIVEFQPDETSDSSTEQEAVRS